jgi:hypothetical protein
MSGRPGDDFDAQIDRALGAIAAPGESPVDLHPRVMAAIGASNLGGRTASRARASALWLRLGPSARPAFGLVAVAALLIIVVLAVWPRNQRDPAPRVAIGVRPAGPQVEDARRLTRPVVPGDSKAPAAMSRGAVQAAATTSVAVSEPWALALPPLDPPEPLALEPIGEPPMQVAELEVERLSIDPLEVDALDRSEQEE